MKSLLVRMTILSLGCAFIAGCSGSKKSTPAAEKTQAPTTAPTAEQMQPEAPAPAPAPVPAPAPKAQPQPDPKPVVIDYGQPVKWPTNAELFGEDEPVLPKPSVQVPGPEVAVSNVCPWDFGTSAVAKKYHAIGMKIELNCKMQEGGFNSDLGKTDLEAASGALEDAYGSFQAVSARAKTIRIGGRPFHNSKESLIQIPTNFGNRSREDIGDYLKGVAVLMDFETKEFGNQVRFSYEDYHLAKMPDGTMVDIGAGAISTPSAERIKGDIQVLKKYKVQILALKAEFPNVRLYHGNQFGYFEINRWDRQYHFAFDLEHKDQLSFFKYLGAYSKVAKSYGKIGLNVSTSAYPSIDFAEYHKLLAVASLIRTTATAAEPIEGVRVRARDAYSIGVYGISIDRENKWLKIENIDSDEPAEAIAKQIKSCLQSEEFKEKGRMTCKATAE